ncbi:unnamed protein product, partial [Sphacelaria rigidula]
YYYTQSNVVQRCRAVSGNLGGTIRFFPYRSITIIPAAAGRLAVSRRKFSFSGSNVTSTNQVPTITVVPANASRFVSHGRTYGGTISACVPPSKWVSR